MDPTLLYSFPPRRIAGDLPDEDVPVVSARGQGVGQCDGVTGHSSELHVHFDKTHHIHSKFMEMNEITELMPW